MVFTGKQISNCHCLDNVEVIVESWAGYQEDLRLELLSGAPSAGSLGSHSYVCMAAGGFARLHACLCGYHHVFVCMQ